MKILFITGGSPATVFALAPLATACRLAGHETFMATIDDLMPAVSGVGLPAVPVTDKPITHFIKTERDGSPSQVPADPEGEMRHTGRWFARMGVAMMPALRALAVGWRPDVVVGGSMSYAAPLLALELGVPYVRHAWDGTDLDVIDIGANSELRAELEALGVAALPEPDLFVDICPPSLRPGDRPVQLMRWVPGNLQRKLEPWMYRRGHRQRVCVTAGSRVGTVQNVDFLRALAKAVAGLGVEMVVAAPDQVAAELSGDLDVRVGWVPLDVVAPTLDLVVHHAGGVTSMTALNAGVPQLLLPKGANFTTAAQRIADQGAARVLLPGEDSPEDIADACAAILGNPSYQDGARKLSAEIASLPTAAEVVDVLAALPGRALA